VHSYCVIPSNIPFVIQRDVLVCEQSDRRHDSLQTYITAVSRCFLWRIRTPNAFVRRHSIPTLHRIVTLRVSDFTSKCTGVFVVYLNITERSSQLTTVSCTGEYYWRVISEQSGESLLFALLCLGNFKTSGCLVGRPTCAPATTRLTLN